MTISDSLIIAATLLGPVIAIQVQKFLERQQERNRRKLWVFHTLMATRATRLSPIHVEALNSIDVVFYGDGKPTPTEKGVTEAWKEYLTHLEAQFDRSNEGAVDSWVKESGDLFLALLVAMAKDVGFHFDRVHLRKGGYSPTAHGDAESDQNAVRVLTKQLLLGKLSLPINITHVPVDEDLLQKQRLANEKMVKSYTEDGALRVSINGGPGQTGQPAIRGLRSAEANRKPES